MYVTILQIKSYFLQKALYILKNTYFGMLIIVYGNYGSYAVIYAVENSARFVGIYPM